MWPFSTIEKLKQENFELATKAVCRADRLRETEKALAQAEMLITEYVARIVSLEEELAEKENATAVWTPWGTILVNLNKETTNNGAD